MNRKLYLSLVVLLVATFVFGQSETRKLSGFTSVSVGQSIDLELIPGNEEKAVIDISGSIDLADVVTEVSGSRLKISLEDRRGGYRNVDVRIQLTYRTLEGIRSSSSSNVFSKGVISGDRLDVVVSSSADVELEIDVEELEVEVSSSGDCTISGRTTYQDIEVSSSGEYNAYDLESEKARVDVSSSGRAKILLSKEIDADASSSGTVTYKGDPDKVWVNASSSGKVRKY